MPADSRHPLEGVRVIDLGTFITGPSAAMTLGDLGADVLKVERPPGGDPFRNFEGGLYSPHFQAYNKGKQSIMLDFLKSDTARQTLADVIGAADVLIENFRPGVMESVGLGPADCAGVNPRLVYCRVSGFGSDGPRAAQPCYDTVGQALSGFLSQMVDPATPRIAGPAIADSVTGLYAAQGVLAALFERERTGRGRFVDVAMVDSMLSFAAEPFHGFLASGRMPSPSQRARVSQAFVFTCADGKLVAVHLSSPPKFWTSLLAATGAVALASDPRFATREARVSNADALRDTLQPIFARRPLCDWLPALEQHDVPHAPVNGFDDVMADAQIRHRLTLQSVPDAQGGAQVAIRGPWRFAGSPPLSVAPPPRLDEHHAEILRWLHPGEHVPAASAQAEPVSVQAGPFEVGEPGAKA